MNDALQQCLRDGLRRPIERVGMREVAKRAGMHHPTISAWLAGRRTMPLDRIEAIAEACGLKLKVLVSIQGPWGACGRILYSLAPKRSPEADRKTWADGELGEPYRPGNRTVDD